MARTRVRRLRRGSLTRSGEPPSSGEDRCRQGDGDLQPPGFEALGSVGAVVGDALGVESALRECRRNVRKRLQCAAGLMQCAGGGDRIGDIDVVEDDRMGAEVITCGLFGRGGLGQFAFGLVGTRGCLLSSVNARNQLLGGSERGSGLLGCRCGRQYISVNARDESAQGCLVEPRCSVVIVSSGGDGGIEIGRVVQTSDESARCGVERMRCGGNGLIGGLALGLQHILHAGVDARREDRLEDLLPDLAVGAKERRELALRQDNRLQELVLVEPDDALDLDADFGVTRGDWLPLADTGLTPQLALGGLPGQTVAPRLRP